MALETFSYISSLVPANPTSTDPVSQGDDHLRGIKTTLVNSFPNVTGAVIATQAQLNSTVTLAATYAPLASPAFTGNPTAPTPPTSDNDTTIATTAFTLNSITNWSLGYNQTWQNVTGSRSLNTVYTNTTLRPIFVSVGGTTNVGGVHSFNTTLNIQGVQASTQVLYQTSPGYVGTVSGIVPPGATYQVTGNYSPGGGAIKIQFWSELR